MESLPPLFLERLKHIIPPGRYPSCLESFSLEKPLSVRVNTLKTTKEQICAVLRENKITFDETPAYADALIVRGTGIRELEKTGLLKKGFLYIQSLSSMLPALVLNPKRGESVLDMCAAPGSKTTQMAALMDNNGSILAIDSVKDRYYRLRAVIDALGAGIVSAKLMDAKRFKFSGEFFDKILVDAPCSSEGRFHSGDKKTFLYWSPRKIKEMVNKQRGLLLTASRLLKPEGVLVYSTCTFAPEENEGVIDWLLRKTGGNLEVAPIRLEHIEQYPSLETWQEKTFNSQVKNTFRVLPGKEFDGFFMARIVKK